MKTKLLLLGLLAPCMLAAQERGFVIEGTVGRLVPKQVFLMGQSGTGFKHDSTTVKDGKFYFRGSVEGATSAGIPFDYTGDGWMGILRTGNPDMLGIMIANEDFTVVTADSIRNGVVGPSKIGNENIALGEAMGDIRNSGVDAALAGFNKFVAAYPQSPLGVDAVRRLQFAGADQAVLQSAFDRLDPSVRNLRSARDLAVTIANMNNPEPEIGKPAFAFTQNDPDGNPVNLSDFRGKYLLIDFWASWCVPCRRENPHVVAAYEKYKGEKFEILGISLDYPGNHDRWIEAVEKDGLTWPQVSDLQGWNNAVAVLYCIKGVPSNYLIDPNGVIIAANLRGDALEAKLAEIFGK